MRYVTPSTRETAFNCPHCGALAKQFWYTVRADIRNDDNPLPHIPSKDDGEDHSFSHVKYDEIRQQLVDWANRIMAGQPFFSDGKDGAYSYKDVSNVHISQCFNCAGLSIWLHTGLIHPARGEAPPANPDLPDEIRRDYDEASSILELSPRGAAALVRLCIQKLCKHLGQSGENINADIGALVKAGLDTRLQQALDAVRVIGNNAVHPGVIDLRDDRATAESLFRLLNMVADRMISEPKHVAEIYAKLPQGNRDQIAKRDATKS